MPRSGPQLAKLTRPRLHGAVSRERLFKLLDEGRERPAMCVVGPPGAGKTTLVASWLDARKLPGIWYQVDSGDADLPTLFHYLGQAAAPFARKGQRLLPALTPEYLQDIPGFTRRFFRELFSRLPSPSVLVLDNYQEVPPESAFHEAVSLAVEEVPKGLNLIAVSRADPPTHYARFIANETVVLLEWDDLKLTLEETRAIARIRTDLPEIQIGRLHEKSGGWAAGLTLLTERLRRGGSIEQIDAPESLQDVFSYFAGQLFDRAPEDRRVLLMQLSYLPSVTEQQAEWLSGQPGAGRLLEELWPPVRRSAQRGGARLRVSRFVPCVSSAPCGQRAHCLPKSGHGAACSATARCERPDRGGHGVVPSGRGHACHGSAGPSGGSPPDRARPVESGGGLDPQPAGAENRRQLLVDALAGHGQDRRRPAPGEGST
jgi:LuxR family maltose regulon positive regulatory protein